jgi:DNA-binding response OmpR family regulator
METKKQSETILVVDDERMICTLVKIFLEMAGYDVLTATDGEEGLRIFRQHQPRIMLLLTDVMMPHMNGLDLANHVLRVSPHVPVLFMSASFQSASPGCGCLAKPFTQSSLINAMDEVLELHRAMRTAESRDCEFTYDPEYAPSVCGPPTLAGIRFRTLRKHEHTLALASAAVE